jgi:succinate dehydrogenase flavin-adding protein (antitoxin of CptAB toxin-antitoxin module)
MRVEERPIEGSTDIMFDIVFEEEDAALYESFVKVAEAEGKTAQEVLDEILSQPATIFESLNKLGA